MTLEEETIENEPQEEADSGVATTEASSEAETEQPSAESSADTITTEEVTTYKVPSEAAATEYDSSVRDYELTIIIRVVDWSIGNGLTSHITSASSGRAKVSS